MYKWAYKIQTCVVQGLYISISIYLSSIYLSISTYVCALKLLVLFLCRTLTNTPHAKKKNSIFLISNLHNKNFYSPTIIIFFYKFIYFYFWLHWVFVAAHGLSLVAMRGATLCCGAGASHCYGFSCCRARALGAWASTDVARGLSSCGARA